MRLKIIFGFLLCVTANYASAQLGQSGGQGDFDKVSFGLGLGLDYGGIGGSILVYPQQNIGFFVGGGYPLTGFGYNFGTKLRLTNSSSIHPYLIGMYGYNTAIAVSNAQQYSKLFYGTSFGFGLDRETNSGNGYWSIALLIPVRGTEVDNYINQLKSQGVVMQNSLSPVAFSIGYHFIIE